MPFLSASLRKGRFKAGLVTNDRMYLRYLWSYDDTGLFPSPYQIYSSSSAVNIDVEVDESNDRHSLCKRMCEIAIKHVTIATHIRNKGLPTNLQCNNKYNLFTIVSERNACIKHDYQLYTPIY